MKRLLLDLQDPLVVLGLVSPPWHEVDSGWVLAHYEGTCPTVATGVSVGEYAAKD